MKKVLTAAVFAFSVLMLCAEEAVTVQERVVTAEKKVSYTRETGRDVEVIGKEEIEKSGATSVAEVLKNVSGVVVSDYSGNGKSAVVDVRGQGEAAKNNVVVLVDGVKQNNMDMSGTDMFTVDVSQIDRIEVIKGANSVLYGDKAIAGVINIITKKDGNKKGIIFNTKGEVANYNSKKGNFSTGYKGENTNILLFVGNNSQDGYRENSYLDAFDTALNAGYKINQNSKLEFRTSYHKDRYGLPGSLTEAKMIADRKQASTKDDYGKTELKDLQLQYLYKDGGLDWKSYISYTDKSNMFYMWGSETNINSDRVQGSTSIVYDSKNNVINGGIDLGKEKSKNTYKQAVGIYVYDSYSIGEKIEINGGTRAEFTNFKFESGTKKDYNKGVFETGAKYFYSKSGTLYTRYAQGYRTPATDEYYEAPNAAWGIPEHYNENLKPQSSDDVEIGVSDYIDYIGNIETVLYYSKTKNEIYYDGTHNNNMAGKTLRKGADVTAKNGFGNFDFYETISFVKTEVDGGPNDGKEVPGVPKYNAVLGANWKVMDGLEAGAVYKYVGKRFALSDTGNIGGKVSSYSVTDLELRKDLKSLRISTGIKNLFNKKYSEYVVNYGYGANYYPSPERTVYLGISYKY